jgi:hypothetical protein
LSYEEMISFNGGGGPTTDSSLAYDILYYAGKTVRFVQEAFRNAVEHPIRPSEYR